MTKELLTYYKGHYQSLFRLGLPIIIGQLGTVAIGFADTIMVGHHSTMELGAASFVNNVFTLAIIFCLGFSFGLTPIVGSLLGNGNKKGAGESLRNSMLANGLVVSLICAVMMVVYYYVDEMGQPEELLPLIKPYFLIQLISMPFVMLFNGFKQFTDGIMETRVSMNIMLSGVAMNIIGNYLLINGSCGFPELGLMGAGIATLVARMWMPFLFAWVLLRSSRFAPYREGFFQGCFSFPSFKRLNGVGWPLAFQMGIEAAAFSLSAVMVGWIGTVALAAHQIMTTVSLFLFLVYAGLGNAMAVRISNFVGQNDWRNVRNSAYAGFHLILLMVVVQSTIVLSLRDYIAPLFSNSEEVASLIPALILPLMLYQFGDGLQIAFSSALRGIADVKPMLLIAFVSYVVIALPLGYVFGFVFHWGISGIWYAFPFGLTVAGVAYFCRFRHQTKTKS